MTTLTKKSSESLTSYYEDLGVKVKYLHSEIKTAERTDIIRNLRLGVFDVLIGVNLLRYVQQMTYSHVVNIYLKKAII